MDMNSLSQIEQGYVHLYVGDGKGKTTAAVGLAVRYAGRHPGQVLFCQFLKARATSEIVPLQQLGIEVHRAACSEKFFFQLDDTEKAAVCQSHGECLQEVAKYARNGNFGLIVLDEVVDAVNCGAVAEQALLHLLASRSPQVEVVLTGRNPSPDIVDAADYYTEFVCKKHPYKTGTLARSGIEF